MILGFFFVRPVPLPEEELNREVYSETSYSAYEQRSGSNTPLLNHDLYINGQDDARIGVELSPSLGTQNCETSRRSLSRDAAMALDLLPNLYGKKLWCCSDFWLLCGILSIRTFALAYLQSLFISNILLVVSGTGLMCMSFRKHSLAPLC
jgi:hypothetical protein